MKRDVISKKAIKARSHYGLFFWQECVECGREFRREQVYKFEQEHVSGRASLWRYICSDCCSDIEQAHEIAECFCPAGPKPDFTPPALPNIN